MQSPESLGSIARVSALAATVGAALFLAGCGMPGAPQPPSLNLPNRVTNLSAVRTGDQVSLTWTMPTRNTDKLLLKGDIAVSICRNQSGTAGCSAAASLHLAPAADGAFTDTLPSALAAGAPRALTYFVELGNRKGRSAGISNGAEILAGQAPSAVDGLRAEMRKDGVLLQWAPVPSDAASIAIRIERKLLTPPVKKPSQGPLAPPPEPLRQILLVEPHAQDPDHALDTSIRFGEAYEYRAQRVARVAVNGQTLELAGPFSAPLRVDAVNQFPPTVPGGLAAVATAGENGNPPAIDLSWLPDTETDLAGYIVYRREPGATPDSNAGKWQRILPAQPVVGPGFHDVGVQPGHTYSYAVTAIDQDGHESARSAEAQETVPTP
jgi:hypothetical protein